ncbi:MAG: 50S ribosomal protein L25 [Planctomycetes bacterium]|nr:50S ribosomal protein L25 [Planctomycetota bacterium]
MEIIQLKAEVREHVGTRIARRQRRQGLVPVVLLRKKESPLHLLIASQELERALKRGARMVDLTHPQGSDRVFIKEIQYDHFGDHVYHVDFTKVAMDEMLTLDVSLVVKGKPVGVQEEGGVLDQYIRILKIQCLPSAIPDKLEIDVSHLKKDQHLTIRDIAAPPGVKLIQDPDLVVAAVTEHKEEEIVPAAVTPGPTEPELIKKEKAEEVAEEGEGAAKKEEKAASKKEEKK